MGYEIEAIEIEGFRGYRARRVVHFSKSLVILRGPNGSGKSSTVNAVGWALVGKEMGKTELGPLPLQERANWLLKNIHSEQCEVILRLRERGGHGTLCLKRTASGKKESIRLERDGARVDGGPLDTLSLSLDGFVSSVYLPQEVVRAALAMGTDGRGRVFEQLVGLIGLRDLQDTLSKAVEPLKNAEAKIQSLRASVDDSIQATVANRKKDLEAARKRAVTAGLPEAHLAPSAAPTLAAYAVRALQGFADEFDMARPSMPEVKTVADIETFADGVRRALDEIERDNPLAGKQKALCERQSALAALSADLQRVVDERKKLEQDRQSLTQAHGTPADVEAKQSAIGVEIERIEEGIHRVGGEQAVISKALDYLRDLPDRPDRVVCPVCETADRSLAQMREHLARRVDKDRVEPLRKEKGDLESRLESNKDALKGFADIERREKMARDLLADIRRRAGDLSDRPLAETDDTGRVVNALSREVKEQLSDLTRVFDRRAEAVQQVRSGLEKVELARQVHHQRVLLDQLNEMPRRPEYLAFKDLEYRAQACMSIAAELLKLVESEKKAAFNDKFRAVEGEVMDLYRRLVPRPEYHGLIIDPQKWTVRVDDDKDKWEIGRLFNVGDLTGVALCLFLGTVKRSSHGAAFVLLDDPSQGLDADHKARLARILAEIARERQVVVASADEGFLAALEETTVDRKVVEFRPFDPERGVELA